MMFTLDGEDGRWGGGGAFLAIVQLCIKYQTKLAKITEEKPDRYNQMMG